MSSTLNVCSSNDQDLEIREELAKHTDAILKYIAEIESTAQESSSVEFQTLPMQLALTQKHTGLDVVEWVNKEDGSKPKWCVCLVTCSRFGKHYTIMDNWEHADTKLEAYKVMTKWVAERYGAGKRDFDWKGPYA